jgi:hypothetical protein
MEFETHSAIYGGTFRLTANRPFYGLRHGDEHRHPDRRRKCDIREWIRQERDCTLSVREVAASNRRKVASRGV